LIPRPARLGFCLFILILVAFGRTPRAGDFGIKAGIGYEYLSQDFYLDSLTQVGADTLTTLTAIRTTYLDNVKGQLTLTYQPYDGRELELRGSYEQTSEQFRAKLLAEFHPKLGRASLDGSLEIDRRHGVGDEIEPGDQYTYGYGVARLMLPISEHTSLRWQIRSEFVDFDAAGAYTFDHFRGGGSFGVTRYFGGFSSFDVSAFLMGRNVPDSTRLSYLSYGFESSLFGFYAGGEIDALTRFEIRDYNSFENQDDYLRVEVDARNRVELGGEYFSRQEFELEATRFEEADAIAADYGRFRLAVLAGRDFEGISIAVGPRMELLRQQADISFDEDYFEPGIKVQGDFLRSAGLYASVESILGHRNYGDADSSFHTDFVVERLNFLGDLTVAGRVSLNTLLSVEWEWHDATEQNSRLLLLSSGLSYSF
jgi:hypothetical protein